MQRLVVYAGKGPAIRKLIAAAGVLGAGAAVLSGHLFPPVGWALVGVGTVWAMLQLRGLGEDRERLVIDDAGIRDTMLPCGTIGWSDVRGVSVQRIGRVPVVALELRDPERYIRRLPPFRRLVARKALLTGLPGVYLTVSGADAGADAVAEIIRRRIDAQQQPSRRGP